MIATEWRIAKSDHTCTHCEAKFAEGQSYYSVLLEQSDAFERKDYCETCFHGHRPADLFSFWKTSVPIEDEDGDKKPVLDVESVMDFFRRLSSDQQEQRVAFRFVLALMLTRKKVLKLEGSDKREDGSEVLVFKERGGELHEVLQPDLDESEIGSVSEELGRLLGIAPPPAKASDEEEDGAEEEGGQEIQADARNVGETCTA